MKKNRNFLSLMHNFYFPLFFVCFLQWVCIWQAHFPNNFSDFFFVQWSTLRKVCCFCWQILIKGTWPSTALCTLHPALEVEGLLEQQQQFAYRRKHAWVQNSTTVGEGEVPKELGLLMTLLCSWVAGCATPASRLTG